MSATKQNAHIWSSLRFTGPNGGWPTTVGRRPRGTTATPIAPAFSLWIRGVWLVGRNGTSPWKLKPLFNTEMALDVSATRGQNTWRKRSRPTLTYLVLVVPYICKWYGASFPYLFSNYIPILYQTTWTYIYNLVQGYSFIKLYTFQGFWCHGNLAGPIPITKMTFYPGACGSRVFQNHMLKVGMSNHVPLSHRSKGISSAIWQRDCWSLWQLGCILQRGPTVAHNRPPTCNGFVFGAARRRIISWPSACGVGPSV